MKLDKKLITVIAVFLVFVGVVLALFFLYGNRDDTQDKPSDRTSGDVRNTVGFTETDKKETLAPETTVIHTVQTENIADTTQENAVTESETAVETEAEPLPADPSHVRVTGITLTHYSVYLNAGEYNMPIVTMYPENATDKGEIWTSSDTDIAVVDAYGSITGMNEGQCTVTVTSKDNPNVYATVSVTVKGNALTYINGILIVNKTYSLPKAYAPGMDAEAYSMLCRMFSDAKAQGYDFWVTSGYRSYIDQYIIYNDYVKVDGQAEADRYSARPGHSEHQSGLAFDLNDLVQEFGDTAEGKWLAENCHKYGFIIRYPKEKESVTGYIYEPWHVRYIGVDNATKVFESGLCLEEYLGITSAYSY